MKKKNEPIEQIFSHLLNLKKQCGSLECFLRHCVIFNEHDDSEFDLSKEEASYVNKYISKLKKDMSSLDSLVKKAVKKYKD